MKMVSLHHVQSLFIYSAVTLAGIVVSTTSVAARIDYSMGLEAVYSDNATLTSEPANEVDELNRKALLGIALEENTSSVTADISSLIEFNDYREDVFADEATFYLNGNSTWTIRPSSFFWVIEDYYSQQKRDSLEPGLPDNLIDTNVFSTGPDFSFRLNPANRLNVGSRFNDYRFEDTEADSQRMLLNIAWLRRLSRSVEVSLNAEYQQANFEKLEDSDFERYDLFARLNTEPSRSRYQFDLGVTHIDRQAAENVDGYLARIIWHNQFRGQSSFDLDALVQYTDSGMDLLYAGAESTGLDRVGEQIGGDIFYDKRLEATYQLHSGVSNYVLQARYRDEDFEILPQDRRGHGLRLGFDHVFSPTTTFNSQLVYQKNDNIDSGRIDRERSGQLAMIYRMTRNYTLRFEYQLNTQRSTESTAEYDENRVLVSFYYGRDPGTYR